MNVKGSTKKTMLLLFLLLAVSFFLGTQGFTVFTQTVSGNGTAATGSREQENDGKEGDSRTEPEDGTAGVEEKNVEAAPTNPIHHCTKKDDGTDYTDFIHIYFGSYPQSEVTDEATRQAIDSAISQGLGQSVGTSESSEGTDVWVNETKYRRISKTDTNHSEYFDDVSNNNYRYFKWERIKWRVLQNDGSTLFVVADKAVDCKDYNEEHTGITWETSTIRNWLNTSFYSTAFSSSEQGAIVTQNVVNEDNPYYGVEGGNDTSDKIYLLSISEVTNEAYGFCSDYSTVSMSRRMKTSDYANARGAWRSSSSRYEGNCWWWWLRSPGTDCSFAAVVNYYGYVDRIGCYVDDGNDGVCPALHINLSSGIWSMVDDGISGEGENGGGNNNRVQAPQASLPGGTYTAAQKITLSSATEGAEIYYTTDASILGKEK